MDMNDHEFGFAFIPEGYFNDVSTEDMDETMNVLFQVHATMAAMVMDTFMHKVQGVFAEYLYSDESPTEAQILEAIQSMAAQTTLDGPIGSLAAVVMSGTGMDKEQAKNCVMHAVERNVVVLKEIVGKTMHTDGANVFEKAFETPVGWTAVRNQKKGGQ